MINLFKNIPKIVKKKKKFKSILIIGGGEWARMYLSVLLNTFFEVEKIIIYSRKNYNYIKNKIVNKYRFKNVKIYSNFRDVKKEFFSHVVIANKTSQHFCYIKKLLYRKCFFLIEKPITKTVAHQKKLIHWSKINKIKFAVGFQRFYAYYFHFFKKRILDKTITNSVDFIWYDKNVGNNSVDNKIHLNNFNNKIYLENFLYHITMILFIFYGKKKIDLIEKNKFFCKIIYGKITVNIYYSNSNRKRIRKIIFKNKKKDNIVLNWTNESKTYYLRNGIKKLIKMNFSQHNLQYQIYYFLDSNVDNFVHLPNSSNSLFHFFEFLKKIKQ